MIQSDYYLEFENNFRGKRKDIIDRLKYLDPLIDLLIKNTKGHRLLDVGCGRGEWLQKIQVRIPDSSGIELDLDMINLCRNNGLDIIRGDALETLSKLKDNSISIITIFHMIEHMKYPDLFKLIEECYRILTDDGILIMETPSIDSLLISTKQFYIDPTHINHIHPDGLSFFLENTGFHKSQFYYINGGPLSHASSLKITRVLNGVAQDLLFVASKGEKLSNLIFQDNNQWEKNLGKAPTTLEAAVDFDLENERLWRENNRNIELHYEEIEKLKDEILVLKSQLKYFLIFLKITKILFKPVIAIAKRLKKSCYLLAKKILNKCLKLYLIRKILLSRKVLKLISFILEQLPDNLSKIILIELKDKMSKLDKIDHKSIKFNRTLYKHHMYSLRSQAYTKLLIDLKSRNIK